MGSHSSATLTARSRTPARLLSGRRRTASRISKHWSSSRFAETAKVLSPEGSSNMQYRIAPLFCRPWTLNGISPRLIESHYEHNYGGALNALNAITSELESLDPSTTPVEVINRLKRDELTALNSTLLHELYFASLGGDGRKLPEVIAGAIARDFGSIECWRQEFVALATALAGSSGWVLLTYVPRDGRLINQTASDHGENISG